MTIPDCRVCGAAHWTGTYLSQNERRWSIERGQEVPSLDYEDEDFGEWNDLRCLDCDQPPDSELHSAVLNALLGASGRS